MIYYDGYRLEDIFFKLLNSAVNFTIKSGIIVAIKINKKGDNCQQAISPTGRITSHRWNTGEYITQVASYKQGAC
ncbi:hypothetical protein [Microseira wollei]|uniref:hypothetical protein n=1 Tax=Microseira wollei TaxID=467598 RepID=UPI001CFD99A4|nr:hypothetical protein [Microseira wollei]